jgi:hypothetical protein
MIIAHTHFVGKHEGADRRHWCMQTVLVRIDLEGRGGGRYWIKQAQDGVQ